MVATEQPRGRGATHEVAVGRVVSFAQQFGEVHLNLACHAAFPLALTPDLLYRIWANFLRQAPWIAVADLLLSPLCRLVGYELYEMDVTVRNLLLKNLREDERFGQQRLNELADFLMDYVAQQLDSHDPDVRNLAQAQRWTALAYAQPSEAASELGDVLAESVGKYVGVPGGDGSFELLRLTSLMDTFSEPLAEFGPLLIYARGVADYVRGDLTGAVDHLRKLTGPGRRVHVAGASLPISQQVPEETVETKEVSDQVPGVSFRFTGLIRRLVAGRRRDESISGGTTRYVVIIGAGDAGRMIVREMQANPQLGLEPVGFIDDDPAKQGVKIQGLPVLGDWERIPEVVRDYKISQAIIAMPTAPGKTIRRFVELCQEAGVEAKTIPGVYELLSGQVSVSQIRDVDIEDLLRREPVQIEADEVVGMVKGKRVLVTGAGGSIGLEICRQVAQHSAAELVLLGHGENSIFRAMRDLAAEHPDMTLHPVIADIRDRPRLEAVFRHHQPCIVFHAAAHKHVPIMECNVEEAVSNNVLGTQCLIGVAEDTGVERFVLISTDKAVNPCSVMGATKRVAELLVEAAAERNGRIFVAVRFGNVLGSRGSVVRIFREQIGRGGPVTVTHPDMRRYFMTIPEAVQLVLQAAAIGQGGEVFVLDMGEPVAIVDLAHDLIRLSGLEVGRDIDIEFTGIRPGEKLFEELFADGEVYQRTHHEKIFIAKADHFHFDGEKLRDGVLELERLAREMDQEGIRRKLRELVPEYELAVG